MFCKIQVVAKRLYQHPNVGFSNTFSTIVKPTSFILSSLSPLPSTSPFINLMLLILSFIMSIMKKFTCKKLLVLFMLVILHMFVDLRLFMVSLVCVKPPKLGLTVLFPFDPIWFHQSCIVLCLSDTLQ